MIFRSFEEKGSWKEGLYIYVLENEAARETAETKRRSEARREDETKEY